MRVETKNSECQENQAVGRGQRHAKHVNVIRVCGVISLLALVLVICGYKTKGIELRIAYNGCGPQDYVNRKLHPENFKNDWTSGNQLYGNSLIMKVYRDG